MPTEKVLNKRASLLVMGWLLLILGICLVILVAINFLRLDVSFRILVSFVGALCIWAGLEYLLGYNQLILTDEGITQRRKNKIVMQCKFQEITSIHLGGTLKQFVNPFKSSRLDLKCSQREISISLAFKQSDIKLLFRSIVDNVGPQVDTFWLKDYLNRY